MKKGGHCGRLLNFVRSMNRQLSRSLPRVIGSREGVDRKERQAELVLCHSCITSLR